MLKANPEEMVSETLTMLLCNAMNRKNTMDVRAHRIRRLAKVIYKRAKDRELKRAMKRLYKEVVDGQVVLAIETAENHYWSSLERSRANGANT